MDLIVNTFLKISSKDLKWHFSRSSGPGGQNLNKVSSRVELSFDLEKSNIFTPSQKNTLRKKLNKYLINGSLRVVVSDCRTQYMNRKLALLRLRKLILLSLSSVQKERKATSPTVASKKKRIQLKRRRTKIKQLRQNKDLLND